MIMQVKEAPFRYLSVDGHTKIYALVWSDASWSEADGDQGAVLCQEAVNLGADAVCPAATASSTATGGRPAVVGCPTAVTRPRAVLQIVHGAAEHIARYREFAAYLVQHGFVVCGEDHIGHGRTAVPEDGAGSQPGHSLAQLSHMPKDGGRDILIGDVHRLRQLMSERYPQLPYFLLGHSMGSFIVRAYLGECGSGLDVDLGAPLSGAVICGTGQQPALLSAFGNRAARILAALRGEDYRSRLLNGLGMGAFAKAVKQRRTVFDWLSYNQDNVDAYIADELSGKMFSVGAYATLTELTAEVVRPANLAHIARQSPDLPLFFIAGADDPVGEMGAAVKRAYQSYADAGMRNLKLRIYPGARHELLNESIRAEVYADLLAWLEAVLAS
jgi:alpha-beta hydrolase superfamily lysophospholipase